MASNNGTAGKWEVVKKGKKSNSSGGGKNPADKKTGNGGRKALGESNQPSRRKWTWPAVDSCLTYLTAKAQKKEGWS